MFPETKSGHFSPVARRNLIFCMYRSVFFNGQIEKQVSGLTSLLNHPDIPVRVAINRDAVHVIEPKKNVSFYGTV